MAYQGYLIKVKGKGILPRGYFTEYECTPNQETDMNSYTDANGLTHRNILEHTKSSITFLLRPLTLKEKEDFMSYLPNRKKVTLEYWNDEENGYKEGEFYIPPIKYSVRDFDSRTVYYDPVTVELVEY